MYKVELRGRDGLGIPKVKIWSCYGTTLKILQFHVQKIKVLPIKSHQNWPNLA